MAERLIDLTRVLDPTDLDRLPEGLPPIMGRVLAPRIEYIAPETDAGKALFAASLQCGVDDLPEGEGWGAERLAEFSSHLGTHVDAPLHYGSTCEGRPSRTITDIELDELYVDAIVLDVRDDARLGEHIAIDALDRAIERAGGQVPQGGAVLIRTGQERFDVDDVRLFDYPGMSRAATIHLAELGAKVLGTDALAWDLPMPVMARRFRETGDRSVLWDGHRAGREREVFIVQQLANLAALPLAGARVAFFPLRIARASAAPARVVAFVEEG
jgi:kynurenine formamidase